MSESILRSHKPSSRRAISAAGAGDDTVQRLPGRDWILLPALSLLTIAVILGSTESIARRIFRESRTRAIDCMVLNDASSGVRAIPNSVCSEKLAEDRLPIEYRFNSCGHRAGTECGPKPPGIYRIVMAGSSFAMGLEAAREKTFAATLPAELSRQTGRKVDLYNEAMESGFPHSVELRFNEVLAARPDMILWILTPFDIKKVSSVLPDQETSRGSFLARNWSRTKVAFSTESIPDASRDLWQRVADAFGTTRTAFMLRHCLFQSQTQYVRSYLIGGDDESGFLRAEPSKLWQDRMRQFDGYAADIEQRATAAGVPLVVVMLPNRAQAAMISMGAWPAGFDPYTLNDEVRSVIVSHGETYIDILPGFRDVPNPEQGYFTVDGHPNAQGHARFSSLLARELTSGIVPALKVVAQPKTAQETGR
jgi:hypothetical protein